MMFRIKTSKTSVVIKDPLVWCVHCKVLRNCMCWRVALVTLPETPQLLVYSDLVCLKWCCQLAAFHPGKACSLLREMAGWLLVETGAIAFSCAENGHFIWDRWVPFLPQQGGNGGRGSLPAVAGSTQLNHLACVRRSLLVRGALWCAYFLPCQTILFCPDWLFSHFTLGTFFSCKMDTAWSVFSTFPVPYPKLS